MLAQRLGPEPIAMAVRGFAGKTNIAAERDLLLYAAEIGAEFVVGHQAHDAFLEGGAQPEGEFLFDGRGKGDRLDFPAEIGFGLLGQLHAQAGGIQAATLQLRQPKQAVEFGFDLGK